MDIREPEITREQILVLKDDNFTVGNVCIVTGAGTGIGRATALASAVNNLMTVGLDINEKEGKKTQKMARDMGGQMIFIAPINEPTTGEAPSAPYRGLEHIGLSVKGIDAVVADLKAKGVTFTMEPTTIRPGVRIAFLRGPENVAIELLERSAA